MGYACKVQKIRRETQNTYYINLPAAIAEALEIPLSQIILTLEKEIPENWSFIDK